MKRLYILIACEESQAECIAFRALGHYAYSCDVQPCSKFGCPSWHIHGDVVPYLHGRKFFHVQSGEYKIVPRWDLIIAHPPCTFLCRLSSVQMIHRGVLDEQRFAQMQEAKSFWLECYNAEAPFVAVENPVPMARAGLPKPSFYADPSWFGAPHTKKTCYWVRNLPPLMPKFDAAGQPSLVARRRGKYRSRTEPLLACAIAQQWSDYIIKCTVDGPVRK